LLTVQSKLTGQPQLLGQATTVSFGSVSGFDATVLVVPFLGSVLTDVSAPFVLVPDHCSLCSESDTNLAAFSPFDIYDMEAAS
jgi:hypothetical protein